MTPKTQHNMECLHLGVALSSLFASPRRPAHGTHVDAVLDKGLHVYFDYTIAGTPKTVPMKNSFPVEDVPT